MIKPTQVAITWQHLSAKAKDKPILCPSDGYCKPGEMLAIMGPSGAGKTTLRSLLSKKYDPSLSTFGVILANGSQFDQKSFYQFGTFVYQNDLLLETLTVRQTLQFSAYLKIKDKSKANQAVEELIRQFQLQKCQHTYVGGLFLKGISGGQKKRVCIAIEMVAKPSVIILDQPTSGLDSNKAAKVLSILKKFANNGHTIIFTIHQPSYLQYIKLNRLLLLNKGEVIYQGLACEVYNYLLNIGVNVDLKSTISDFFMMEISQYKEIHQHYQTPFNIENYKAKMLPNVSSEMGKLPSQSSNIEDIEIFMQSLSYMFKLLIIRNLRNYWRNYMKFGANIFLAFVRILIVGLLFLNFIPSRDVIDSNPYLYFQQISGLAFLCSSSNLIPAMFAVALSIPIERQLFFKEVDSKKYTPFPFFISKVMIEFLSGLVGTTIYCSGGYWINGYTDSFSHFIGFYLIMVVMNLAGNSLGFLCGTLFREVKQVSAMIPVLMIPLMVVSGLFVKLSSIPSYISWLQYISPFRYGMHLVIENEFRDETFLEGTYNYKTDLGINFSFGQNILITLGLCIGLYLVSFILLSKFTQRIST